MSTGSNSNNNKNSSRRRSLHCAPNFILLALLFDKHKNSTGRNLWCSLIYDSTLLPGKKRGLHLPNPLQSCHFQSKELRSQCAISKYSSSAVAMCQNAKSLDSESLPGGELPWRVIWPASYLRWIQNKSLMCEASKTWGLLITTAGSTLSWPISTHILLKGIP